MSPRWPEGFVAACAALCVASGAVAQVVVLFARGPSAAAYPAGRVLPANQVLSLKAGDQVELLDGAGSHIVAGPAIVTAGHVPAKVRDELIGVFLKAQRTRPGIAATRGFDIGGEGAPSLWQADVSLDGVVCVLPDVTPGLWRGGQEPRNVVIRRVATGETRSLVVPAAGAPWPDALPTTEDEHYDVVLADGTTTALSWKVISPAPTDLESLASALLERGCYDQLRRVQSAFTAP
jgi:hypothetical protein